MQKKEKYFPSTNKTSNFNPISSRNSTREFSADVAAKQQDCDMYLIVSVFILIYQQILN